jgi:hypothetical protein
MPSTGTPTWQQVGALLAGDEINAPMNDAMERRPLNPLPGWFSIFDPRIDGLRAQLGAYWAATDCPIAFYKVGLGDTDWIIAGHGSESALAACTTPAQVNALYRGLARQPLLDFTPTHLLTPNPNTNNLLDFAPAADHLTLQGAGVGASVEKSPLYDATSLQGYQAVQLGGNASYYQAASAVPYDVAGGAFVTAWIASYTKDAGGGVVLGKYDAPAGSDLGFAVTMNVGGGFGFLLNGSLGNLNADTPFGTQPVNDGRLRIFHLGRSVLGAGLGFVRTPDIAPVTAVGLVGTLTNADGIFGLASQVGAATLAQGDQQVATIVRWDGLAAENVIANVAAIEASLGAQLAGGAGQSGSVFNPGLFSQFSAGMVGQVVVSHPARVLDADFAPGAASNRPVLGIYSVRVESGGAGIGHVELRSDAAAPPVTEICRSGGGTAVAILDTFVSVLVVLALPGQNVRLVTVIDAGAPVFTLQAVTEYQF